MEEIIQNYKMLSHENFEVRNNANCFLFSLAEKEEAWDLAEKMIIEQSDVNFQFLGAQIMYQKIEKELHNLTDEMKEKLKIFLFNNLRQLNLQSKAVIEKICSSVALISCTMVLDKWQEMFADLVTFMGQSKLELLRGLIIIERIPEELRNTNRLSHPKKMKIQDYFLEKESLFVNVMHSVLQLNDNECLSHALPAIESWIKMNFCLLKHPALLKDILAKSLLTFDNFESCSKTIVESLKNISHLKFQTINQINPIVERNSYNAEEIESLKSIIEFVMVNKTNFEKVSTTNPEYLEMYAGIVKQLLLSEGFLLLEDVGMQLLFHLLEMLASSNNFLSYSTFEFWTDFSIKIKESNFPENVEISLWNAIEQAFATIRSKVILESNEQLNETENKEDDTDDEDEFGGNISFFEYRKEAQSILQYIYEYQVGKKGEQGSAIYFEKLAVLLNSDFKDYARNTELAIYCLRSAMESMNQKYETANILNFLSMLACKIFTLRTESVNIPSRVLSETLKIIKDCANEVKCNEELFLNALKLCLSLIEDQKLCHYAALCFQILMESIEALNNFQLIRDLIIFYQAKVFTKQVILEKTLEGILSAVLKLTDKNLASQSMKILMSEIERKYLLQKSNEFKENSLLLCLIECKVLLESYETANNIIKKLLSIEFIPFALKILEIIQFSLVMGINSHAEFKPTNELGLSVSLTKICLRIFEDASFEVLSFNTILGLMNIATKVMNEHEILLYFPFLSIIIDTLTSFQKRNVPEINNWITSNINLLVECLVAYLRKQSLDPDIVRLLFSIMEAIFLYSSPFFCSLPERFSILSAAAISLTTINEKFAQKKLLSFILLCIENREEYGNIHETLIIPIFSAIPSLNSLCHRSLSQILLCIFEGSSLAQKEQLISQLFAGHPYQDVDGMVKTMLAKLLAFSLESKLERYVRSTLLEFAEIHWKKTGIDYARDIELKLVIWRREYAAEKQSEM